VGGISELICKPVRNAFWERSELADGQGSSLALRREGNKKSLGKCLERRKKGGEGC